MYRKIWINGTANIWRDWQFLRGMRIKLAKMRYFKAITTIMTVIFFASQPSLGFASWSKTLPKIVITVRTNIPWVPSAIMKAFKKWCFLKNFWNTLKLAKAEGQWAEQREVLGTYQKVFYIPTWVTMKASVNCWLGVGSFWDMQSDLAFHSPVLLISNQVPSSVPDYETRSLS